MNECRAVQNQHRKNFLLFFFFRKADRKAFLYFLTHFNKALDLLKVREVIRPFYS